MRIRHLLVTSLLLVAANAPLTAQGTRLLRRPTVSKDNIAFEYGGDLWVVPRAGGSARRLTSTPSEETDPHFSPDGEYLAYTATVSGNTDVYVVPTRGGDPKRLTWHPGVDFVRGWTPDGKRIVFGSSRGTLPTPGANSFFRLWTVSLDGGMPEMLPAPRAFAGTYAPDARHLAYQAVSIRDVRGTVGGESEQPVAALSRRTHAAHSHARPRDARRREAAVDEQQRH